MTDAIIVLLIAAIATVVSVAFGIVVLAPRLTRLLDRASKDDKEPVDHPD